MTTPPDPFAPAFRETYRSRIAALDGLVHSLTAWCRHAQVPRATVDRLVLVLDELFSNIVIHGYRHDPEGDILVEAQVRDSAVHVMLTDHAPPFNPLLVPKVDTTLPLEARPLGGLGLLFVRNTADALRYELLAPQTPQAANWLRFTLEFDTPAMGADRAGLAGA